MRTKIIKKFGILINFAVEMVQRVHRVLVALMVALFATYYCETTLFVHTHNFYWGSVTHSHPYWPSANHGHDQSECQAISLLSMIVLTAITIGCGFAGFRAVVAILEMQPLRRKTTGEHHTTLLRGPPFSFYFQQKV